MDSNGDFLNKKNVKTMYFWSCYKVLSYIVNSVNFFLFINHCIVWRYCCLSNKIGRALSWTSLASAVSAQTCTHLKSGIWILFVCVKKKQRNLNIEITMLYLKINSLRWSICNCYVQRPTGYCIGNVTPLYVVNGSVHCFSAGFKVSTINCKRFQHSVLWKT